MLHADIVYVLNATRLPGLSDECEKVERVGTQRFGLGEAKQAGRRADWEVVCEWKRVPTIIWPWELYNYEWNMVIARPENDFQWFIFMESIFFFWFKMIQTFERPYAVSAKALFVPRYERL